jgi:hypothetical protein
MPARRRPTLWVIALTMFASGCGGRLLAVPAPGDASSGGDGGVSVPIGAPGSSSDSGGSSTGGGSASSGGRASNGGSASGSSGSSSGGSGMTCHNAAECPNGEVCCLEIPMTTYCQLGPCPQTGVGTLQLCASAAECLGGDTCGPAPEAPTLPLKICLRPAADGGLAWCASRCVGCCDTDGSCHTGGDDTACGFEGSRCVDCTAANEVCDNAFCR